MTLSWPSAAGKKSLIPVLMILVSMQGLSREATAQASPYVVQFAPRPQIVQPIDDSVLVSIPNTRPPELDDATDLGRIQGSVQMGHMLLVLKSSPEQELALQRLLDQQQDENSPTYHRWLTPDEFGLMFGVGLSDIERLTGWLSRHGFTINHVAQSRRSIIFSGTVAQVEQVFRVEIHSYNMAGQSYISNNDNISLPAALTSIVAGVSSLNDFARVKPPHVRVSVPPRKSDDQVPGPLYTTGLEHYLSPGDVAVIYNTQPLLVASIDGNTQTIAIVGIAHVNTNDLKIFRQLLLPSYNAVNTNVCYLDANQHCGAPDPGPNFPSKEWEGENMLDVEWAGATAPKATIEYVAFPGQPVFQSFFSAAEYVVNGNFAPIMSLSAQVCEAALDVPSNSAISGLWAQAAAQGITVFVAAGDDGSAGCDEYDSSRASQGYAVNAFASSPYNVAVGGSEFTENGNSGYWSTDNYTTPFSNLTYTSAIGYIPEEVWNESGAVAGGAGLWSGSGGISSCYLKPPWQVGPGVLPNDPIPPHNLSGQSCPFSSTQHRDVPDVSLTAAKHDAYLICNSDGSGQPCSDPSNLTKVGGTSVASPALSGIQALIDEQYGRQGQANYVYYRLAKQQHTDICNSAASGGPDPSCVFNDATTSSNRVPCLVDLQDPDCPEPGVLQYFDALVGYDLSSGLGSVNGNNLLLQWKNVSGSTKSDLVETAVSNPPPTVNPGGTFPVTDMVLNQGTAAGASVTRFYLSLDTARNTGDKLLTGTRAVLSLPAGASSTGTTTVTVPKTTALAACGARN